MPWPAEVTNDAMQQRFVGGPDIKKKGWVFVLLGSVATGRIYKREGDRWYLLEDKPRHELVETRLWKATH